VRGIDLSSWQGFLSTLIAIALFALVGVGIRLVLMQRIQQRRERMNRQINERLKTLIAAYKVLGGSFTGRLSVDPRHLRELRRETPGETTVAPVDLGPAAGSDRARRTRDAVEAALSDIILLGTEDHVRLAGRAATELAEGRPVHVDELVVSLRDFIRKALDLDPVPGDVAIPRQGPKRPGGSEGRGGTEDGGGRGARGGGAGGGGGGGGAGPGLAAAGRDDAPG
jgi:uncharacterized membrane protein YgcG